MASKTPALDCIGPALCAALCDALGRGGGVPDPNNPHGSQGGPEKGVDFFSGFGGIFEFPISF